MDRQRTEGPSSPRVSVIVSTNGRCESLASLVACLRHQQFRDFELCLVCGPKDDGTRELARTWAAAGEAKLVYIDEANLARSRNAGLAIAAGDYVAFIDDDALPEPAWLSDLAEGLVCADVAGVGGLVFEPDGRLLQFRYSACDRFGMSTHGLAEPADAGAFPLSPSFPHFMGTNCMFRRDVVTAAGGFDEEYQYYLEETDLCCRLVDQGFRLRQLDRAPVYHKFLSGAVRDGAGILVNSYPTLKSQLYFSLRHARGHASLPEILEVARQFMEKHRTSLQAHVAAGRLHAVTLDQFDADVDRAWQVGLTRGLTGVPLLRPASFFVRPAPYLPFPVMAGVGQGRHIVFLVGNLDKTGDLYRGTAQLAEHLAAEGHLVRIVSAFGSPEAGRQETVEFDRGVWIHRLAPAFPANPPSPAIASVDDRFWGQAIAVRMALDRITSFAPVDLVEDRSDSGVSLAVALARQLAVQLHVGSVEAADVLREGRAHHPLAAVARHATRIVSDARHTHLGDDLPSETKARLAPLPVDVAALAKLYSNRSDE